MDRGSAGDPPESGPSSSQAIATTGSVGPEDLPSLLDFSCMKALVLTNLSGPDALRSSRRIPNLRRKPAKRWSACVAGGMNFADLMTTKGGYPGTPPPPLVVGREFAGVEESSGRRVMGYAQWGAFAEKIAAFSNMVWTVPDRLDRRTGGRFSGQLLHGLSGILAGGHDSTCRQRGKSIAC